MCCGRQPFLLQQAAGDVAAAAVAVRLDLLRASQQYKQVMTPQSGQQPPEGAVGEAKLCG